MLIQNMYVPGCTDQKKSVVEIWRGPTVEPEFVEEEDEGSAKRKGVWRFTEAAQLRTKREDVVAALSAREAVVLRAETVAKYGSADGLVRAVVAVSKRYVDRGPHLYWYAYHPEWDAFLADGKKGFFLLGCMDRNTAYAVPRSVIEPHLSELHATIRAGTGKLHWHIHLAERDGELAILLPKRDDALSIEPYAIELPQKKDSPVVRSDTVILT
jgi:hypothetical protein